MPNQEVEEQNEDVRHAADNSVQSDNLALFYQGILTIVVRLRSGKQGIGDINGFRKQILDMLDKGEQQAVRRRYRKSFVENATFAVITFVDESVHNSKDPQRHHWSALQVEKFAKAVGGEDFFKRLEGLQKQTNSAQLADVLEVFLLCLYLGYQGRYAETPELLHAKAEDVRHQIERIRGVDEQLSPNGIAKTARIVVVKNRSLVRFLWLCCVVLSCVVACWVVFRVQLGLKADDIVGLLSGR